MKARDSHVFSPELRRLLDASPDAVLIVDRAGTIVMSNRQAETLFATTGSWLHGRSVESLVPDRVREAHASARAGYVSAPTVRPMSARAGLTGLRADGTEFPVEVSLTPIVGSAAGLVMAVVHDVSSRVRLEMAIARTDRAAEALDAISDAILTTDAEGRIDFLNRSAEELTGLTRKSASGRPLSEVLPLVSEAGGEPLPNPVTACLYRGAPGDSCEGVFPARSGHDSRALDLSTAVIRDSTGAVTGATVVARDVTHARLVARQLSHQATHDALTGLVNRTEFEQRLVRALAGPAGAEHVVCFLDLDGFKKINDACGHLAGDELLRQLSDVMRDRMRSRDTLARLGGDEFGMLLEYCKQPRAERIAKAIRKAISDYRFTFGSDTYAVAVSIGVVPIRAGVGGPRDVLRAADAACYLAKRSGGNRIQISIPDRRAAGMPSEGELSRRVVRAIEEHRFRLYAQPLVALGCGDARSPWFELLLRLDDGCGEPLSPRAFLPAARRRGLMAIVDRWVICEAVRQLSNWRRERPGADHLTVAINLDDETVTVGTVSAQVREVLDKTDVPPGALCFEITESVAAAHPAASSKTPPRSPRGRLPDYARALRQWDGRLHAAAAPSARLPEDRWSYRPESRQ